MTFDDLSRHTHAAESLFYTLDASGKPVTETDPRKWVKFFEAHPRQRKLDELSNGGHVSTIFLGIDVARCQPPLLWETAIIGVTELGDCIERYASRDEALAGHAGALTRAKTMLAMRKK